MTTLGAKGDVDGSSVGHNQGMLKAGLGKLWQVISDLFGTDSGAMRTVHETLKLNGPGEIRNLKLEPSLASNALTMTVKTRAGAVPSAADPVLVSMRNATAATGDSALRQVSAALSLVISSGSTLGHSSGVAGEIYWYLVDSDGAGTMKLAATSTYYGQQLIGSTTAEGGLGAADSATAIYSDAGYTNKAMRLIGRTTDTQAAAGTWVTAPSKVELAPFDTPVTAASGGSLVLLSAQSASNVASVDFTSSIDGTYDEYVVTFANVVPLTNGADLIMRVRDAGSWISSGSYDWLRSGVTTAGGGTGFGYGYTAQTAMGLALSTYNGGAGQGVDGVVRMLKPLGGFYRQFLHQLTYLPSAGSWSTQIGAGRYLSTGTAVDGLRFLMSSGNISGQFNLYGVKKS